MSHHVEDDWELFEQAALLRERESESEEEGSEGSGSMESLDKKSVNRFSTDLFILTTHYFWYYKKHIYSYISKQLLLVYIYNAKSYLQLYILLFTVFQGNIGFGPY